MADYFKFMRCPKCNAVITEHVNTNMALNDASCHCGYEYVETESNVRRDDGTTTDADIDEFYNAPRPKDDDESDLWAEEYYSELMSVPDKELAQWAQEYKAKRLSSGCATHTEFKAKHKEGPRDA